MVKVKLLDIVNSREALSTLMNEKLPMVVSYKLAKIFKIVAPELDLLEQQRQKMIRELGEPLSEDEENGAWKVKKENEKEFQKQFEELLQEEVELDFDPVPVSIFDALDDKVSIAPMELAKIAFIFE